LSLHNGKMISRYAWMELPMPNEVMEHIHRLTITVDKYEGIMFTYAEGNIQQDQMDTDDNVNGPNSKKM